MSLTRRLSVRGAYTPPVAQPYAISGPYAPGFAGSTVLTQVHCHTTASDGNYAAASVVSSYLAAGYGALAITDHDLVTSQPAGITTAIVGNETSATQQHLIALNAGAYTRGATTDAQAIVDGIIAAGGQAFVAHPKWYRGMTQAEMEALTGHLGMELHNGHCVHGSGQNPVTYPGFAVDRWDAVLASRRDTWGLAVDDLHVMSAYTTYDVGRLKVFADTNTLTDVMAALVAGDFVADVSNHGVTPGYPARDGDGISVSCTGATRIEAWGRAGLLSSTDGSSHTHPWDGTESYVRLVARGGYTEGFASALSDRWQAVDGTWAVSGGTLNVSTDVTGRRIILRRHREGDFTAQVDVQLSADGTDGAALMFNVLNGSYHHMVRIGESINAEYHNKLTIGRTTDGNYGAGTSLGSYAFTATAGTWYTIKMAFTASSGLIQAKVWDRAGAEPGSWQATGTSTAWTSGMFGFRANRTCKYDNLYVDGFRTYYQPVSVDAS